MIPGIPDIKRFEPIPEAHDSEWLGNLQFHKANIAGPHIDLRLNPPGTNIALSWAVRKFPEPGQKTTAILQPTHESSYMNFSGSIPSGYGAGTVKSIFYDKVEVLEAKPDKILFNMYKGQDVSRYMIRQVNDKEWLLYNYTGTINNQVPDYKKSYKSIKLKELRTDYKDEIFAPKIDGAHNTILIRPEKRLDVFSYRLSKKSGIPIDHSYRTNLYKVRGPKEMGTTVVRAELYIPGQESTTVGGVLNSNVWKSRDLQNQYGKLQPVMFDVVKYKNKNVEDLPYKDKIEILKEISNKIPELELPRFATTQQEKLKLKDDIISGKHPQTKEGIVIYKMNESVPYKSKKEEDYDVLITGVFPASPGSKYEGNAIGGFEGFPENSKTKIRVGSGLSDELRRDAYLNPNKYIGSWMKVTGQMQYKNTGKLRMPTFKEIRYEKFAKN